jgi:pilus assembly protein CpaD
MTACRTFRPPRRLAGRLAGVVALTLLCACNAPQPDPPDALANQSIPPVLQSAEQQFQYVMSVDPAASGLRDPIRRYFDDFLRQSSAGNPYAVHLTLRGLVAPAAFAGITRQAIDDGVDPDKIEVRTGPVASPPAQPLRGREIAVEAMVSISTAVVPACPRTSRLDAVGRDNRDSSNFGCATVADMAAMVADPRDLSKGESGGLTDSELTTAAIQRLHSDKVKKFLPPGGFIPGGAAP